MEVDSENSRWAQDNADVVWCDTAQGLLQAVQDGNYAVEVGACSDIGAVLEALVGAVDSLDYLSLAGCNLNAEGLVRLGNVLSSSCIKGIGVSNNPDVSWQTWAEFWDLLPTTIHKWDFGDNGLPDEAMPRLAAALQRAENVTEVFLDGNELTRVGTLLPLLTGSCLSELDIGDNSIGDAEVVNLAQALPRSSVETLVLGRNPISDAGAVPLVQALPQSQVSTLHLDSTSISDATLDALTPLLLTTSLRELHLDETQVRDDAILRFIHVLPQSKIILFDCAGNDLSEQTIGAIEAALPSDMCVQ